MASFDGRSAALAFDPSSGLSDGTTLIPTAQIVSLIPPTAAKPEYILLHTATAAALQKSPLLAPPPSLVSRYSLPALPPHLDPALVDIGIIVSVGSGTGQALSYLAEVLQPLLAAHGLPEASYTVHTTTTVSAIHEITRGLSTARQQSLIVLSGDTLIFEILNSLPRPPSLPTPILSLLPLGTGNALSASLSKTSPALSTLLLGSPRRLPAFSAAFPAGSAFVLPDSAGTRPLSPEALRLRGSVVCSWGFHASLVADSDSAEFRRKGRARFQLAAEANLVPEVHAYRGTVSIATSDGGGWVRLGGKEEGEGDGDGDGDGGGHFYTLVSLVSNLEETFCISPRSRPARGDMHIVYFPVVPAAEVMRIMALAYQNGSHAADPKVTYERVVGVKIEVGEAEERWRRFCIDGAIVVVPEGGTVEVSVAEGIVDVVYRE